MDDLDILQSLILDRSVLKSELQETINKKKGLSTNVENKLIYQAKIGDDWFANVDELRKSLSNLQFILIIGKDINKDLIIPVENIVSKNLRHHTCIIENKDVKDLSKVCGWRKEVYWSVYADCRLSDEMVMEEQKKVDVEISDIEDKLSSVETKISELIRELGGEGE